MEAVLSPVLPGWQLPKDRTNLASEWELDTGLKLDINFV